MDLHPLLLMVNLALGVCCGLKPSQLARHLKSKNPEHEDKSLQFFQRGFKSCDTQSSTLQNFTIKVYTSLF